MCTARCAPSQNRRPANVGLHAKCHWLLFGLACIPGPRALSLFLVELGAAKSGVYHGAGAGIKTAGRPRESTRLAVLLIYRKNAFNESDANLIQHW